MSKKSFSQHDMDHMVTVTGSIKMEHPSLTFQKAVLLTTAPCLDIGVDSKIHLLYLAPGQTIIKPEVVKECSERVGKDSGSSVLTKLSPTMVVKHGDTVNPIEAKTMLFVAEKTSIPVPKLHSAYLHGPLERGDSGELPYDVYIFMEFIEGEALDKQWGQYDNETKSQVGTELKGYMEQLHSIHGGSYIGSVDHGPVTDVLLEWSWPTKGPFNSEEEFNETLAEAYEKHSKAPTGSFIRGMLNRHKHKTVFSHGDFRPANIIVKNGHVAAIIDWEQGGWYPEYWDFVKALYISTPHIDWQTHILKILEPFFCEEAIHSRLSTKLW